MLTKLGYLAASFDNVMAFFVIVFAADLAIVAFLVRRVLGKLKPQASSPSG
jgi:hypothetical protein